MPGRVIAVLISGAVVVLLVGAFGLVAHGAGFTVGTATVMVQGTLKTVLTDEKGMALYYLGTDTLAHSTCTGGCAGVWPPLLGTSTPVSKDPLPGKLALVKTENGSQVSYNGHLLYRYSGDVTPQQANGQGVAGQWRVATPDLKPMTPSTSGGSTSTIEKESGGKGDGGGTGGGGGMGH